jgi:hypothetical protein
MVPPADGADSLQFDTLVPRGATAGAADDRQGLICSACQQTVADEYFDVNGQSVCAGCRDAMVRLGECPRGWRPLVGAGLFGLGAALAGAALYYAVVAITNFEIGLVAIAIGYMVGYGVRKGAGGGGGRRFQIIALLLTYWAVGLAYLPLAMQGVGEDKAKQTHTAKASDQRAETAPASNDVNLAVGVALLVALSLALPVLAVFGSLPGGLITAAIVGFGMQQAWRMTAAPQLAVSGPFRIAASDAPAT